MLGGADVKLDVGDRSPADLVSTGAGNEELGRRWGEYRNRRRRYGIRRAGGSTGNGGHRDGIEIATRRIWSSLGPPGRWGGAPVVVFCNGRVGFLAHCGSAPSPAARLSVAPAG